MRRLTLPYEHLNLRRNPFGELTVEERASVAVVEIDAYVERLRDARFALQVLGEKGNGKTTHLLALRTHFPRSTYRHIDEDERVAFRDLELGEPTFVDECQRLAPRDRRRLFGVPHALVIGSHEDHASELERAGRIVELLRPAEYLDASRLQRLIDVRLELARRGPGPIPMLETGAVQTLLDRFGTDVRAMEHHLYELFQTLPEVRDVQV